MAACTSHSRFTHGSTCSRIWVRGSISRRKTKKRERRRLGVGGTRVCCMVREVFAGFLHGVPTYMDYDAQCDFACKICDIHVQCVALRSLSAHIVAICRYRSSCKANAKKRKYRHVHTSARQRAALPCSHQAHARRHTQPGDILCLPSICTFVEHVVKFLAMVWIARYTQRRGTVSAISTVSTRTCTHARTMTKSRRTIMGGYVIIIAIYLGGVGKENCLNIWLL